MLDISLYALCALMLGLTYRLRGGGFFTLGGDSQCRAVWGGAMVAAFLLWMLTKRPNDIYLIMAPWVFAMSWIGETIPHGFAQNMGRRAASWYNIPLIKRWPGILVPEPTQDEFAAAPYAWRYAADALAMMYIGGLRAAIVLSPSIGYGLAAHSPATLYRAALAVAVRVLWQPLAYTVGWLVPLTLPSLGAKGTEWCELFDGMGWAIAWWVL